MQNSMLKCHAMLKKGNTNLTTLAKKCMPLCKTLRAACVNFSNKVLGILSGFAYCLCRVQQVGFNVGNGGGKQPLLSGKTGHVFADTLLRAGTTKLAARQALHPFQQSFPSGVRPQFIQAGKD